MLDGAAVHYRLHHSFVCNIVQPELDNAPQVHKRSEDDLGFRSASDDVCVLVGDRHSITRWQLDELRRVRRTGHDRRRHRRIHDQLV